MIIYVHLNPSIRFHAGTIKLIDWDINSDLFLMSTWKKILTADERLRWVSFNNLPWQPARFGNRTWLENNADPINCFVNSGCSCDDWNKGGKCDHVVPTKGNGLVFQNLCKEDMSKIDSWRTRPPLPVPLTFPPDPPMRVSPICPYQRDG